MEGMRDVALALYENLADEVKAEIHNDFKREVANGSVSEYLKRNIHSEEYIKHVDKYLETCKGGSLDFNDFITLKYTLENVVSPICDGCSSLIMGVAYFTCWDCSFNSSFNGTFDLCSSCYRSKKFEDHNHQNFMNSQTMKYLATSTLAAAINDRHVRDEFIDFASTLMQIAKSTKTDGWMDYRHEIDSISRRLKGLVEISDAKENAINSAEEEKKSTETRATSLPETRGLHRRIDFLGEAASQEPWRNLDISSDEDEDEDNSTRFTPKPQRRTDDLLGVKASEQWLD